MSTFHLSILYLLDIHYPSCRYPICLLPTLYHITTLHLSSIYHQFFSYPDFTILLFILQVACEYFPCAFYPQAPPLPIFLLLFSPICHLPYRYSAFVFHLFITSHPDILYIQIFCNISSNHPVYTFHLSIIYTLEVMSNFHSSIPQLFFSYLLSSIISLSCVSHPSIICPSFCSSSVPFSIYFQSTYPYSLTLLYVSFI